MKIVYRNTAEDMARFALYELSPLARTRRRWGTPVVYTMSAAVGYLAVRRSRITATESVVVLSLAAVVIGIWAGYRAWQEKAVTARLSEPGQTGLHELEVADSTLIERTSVNATSTRFESLHKIIERRDHYLIYVTPIQAHVVPKDRVTSGDLGIFMSELSDRAGMPIDKS